MEYTATYEIDGGISHGIGTFPRSTTIDQSFYSDKESEAIKAAIDYARNLAQNTSSNPDTDETQVTLTSLVDPRGHQINVEKHFRDSTKEPKEFYEKNFSDGNYVASDGNFAKDIRACLH